MNSKNFFYNAALIFGLTATGISLADEVTTADPSSMTQQEREAYRAERQDSHSQRGGAQGQGTMARDDSGAGGQYGRSGGMGGGQDKGGGRGQGGHR